jgi:hypothetical protein
LQVVHSILMTFIKQSAAYSENRIKPAEVLRGQHMKLLEVKAGLHTITTVLWRLNASATEEVLKLKLK